jgi:hypothetical protein
MIHDFDEKLEQPGQQVMPDDGVAPDFGRVKSDFENAVADSSEIVGQMRQNYETRFAIWPGQSSDGKKRSREGSRTKPTPWDGASDLRTYLVDEVINAKVAMKCTAFRRSNLVAVPIEGTDMKRAKLVTSFMKWLVYTQMPHLDREVELLNQYIEEKGVAISGQFWERYQEKTLETITLEQLEQQMGPDIGLLLKDPALRDGFVAMIQQAMPDVKERRAKQMIRELVQTGETSIPAPLPEYSRPVFRAFNLDEDIFIHPSATDIETAPGIYRIQYYTPAQLRGFAASERWDSDWVEAAISKCLGKSVSALPDVAPVGSGRGILGPGSEESRDGLVGVVHAYEKLTDADGICGIYLTIFNPELPPCEEHDGFAKFGLLGYKHGQYPFVLHRREYLSRRLHDSRGLPEVGKPFQDIVKATRDARNDAASLSVLPPLMHPTGRAPTEWGPGSRYGYRRSPDEVQYADKPTYDASNTEVERGAVAGWKEYCGIAHPESDPAMTALKQQFETERALASMEEALQQIWSLYQQYGKDEVWFRVIGLGGADMMQFKKGDPRERYDFYLTFDSIVFDREALNGKLETLAKLIATFDRNGQVDFSELLPIALDSVDPALAEKIVIPKEQASQKAVEEIQTMLAKMFAGIDVDWKEGMPAELGQQVLQNYAQAPEVQQRVQNEQDPLRERLEKLQKQMQFQITQRENAQIGRLGA